MPNIYRITRREPLLFYPNDPAGPHLSAASGVAWLGASLVVVDDASVFAGVYYGATPPGRSLRLLPSIEGHDHFTEAAGTKALKPDLEVLVPLPDGSLLALGSGSRNKGVGSRAARTRAVKIYPDWRVEVFELGPLYQAISLVQDSLNIEGALVDGSGMLLLLRGNGVGGRPMVVRLIDLAEALAGRPTLGEAREVWLPKLAGSQLGFTDACTLPDGSRLAALAAEDSADVYADGAVAGSALYDFDVGVVVQLLDNNGEFFTGKLEGICPQPNTLDLLGVTDPDDPQRPGELLWLQRETLI
jgi:hypothetical protein